VLCHSASGPASGEFDLAGTVFATKSATAGAADVEVQLLAPSLSFSLKTNRAGNFFLRKGELPVAFPISVTIYKENVKVRPMNSFIGREPSCATCHFGAGPVGTTPPPKDAYAYPASLRGAGPIFVEDG
jgi:hypothetical protein